jgi:hypothetical protein
MKSYELINEQNIIDLVTEVGCQTSDSFSWVDLESAIVKYLMVHTRPGCNCDYSCTDEDCEAVKTDFDHWRQ